MRITWSTDANAPCCPGEILAIAAKAWEYALQQYDRGEEEPEPRWPGPAGAIMDGEED